MYKNVLSYLLIMIFFSSAWNTIYSQHHHDKDSYGVVDFKITCLPSSQPEFNQAMALLHHMTYPQAREIFRRIAEKDSTCAMAEWGYAMTLFQPVWPTRPGPVELQSGWDAVQKAKSFTNLTLREQLLINAAEAFFRDPKSSDYWKRIHDWKKEMEKAYSSLPEDIEVSAFYALSLLATIPPDQISTTNNVLAADILLKILKKNPNHPGAMHYLIHANDAPSRESESIEILKKYKEVAPNNPHALHMPTHIYTRLGNWEEVINGNINAANAALKFPAGDKGQYVWDEFPHAIEYLIYAYLQRGNDKEAEKQLKRLSETTNLEPTFKTAFHIASTRARYMLERKAWNEAATINPREPRSVVWDRFPWPEAIGWFARGFGFINSGNSLDAVKSLEHLSGLEYAAKSKKEILFARNIEVLSFELTAFILNNEGLKDSAITLLKQAVDIESTTPKHAVTPAPTIPANELLGDLLFSYGKFNGALSAYEYSLKINPNRFNSLLGAARSSVALDNKVTALIFYKKIIEVSDNGSEREGYKEAQAYTANN